ncbi:hypothetical protein BT96DRAFT_1020380, partial [Gymnopus androsaceus JB14]
MISSSRGCLFTTTIINYLASSAIPRMNEYDFLPWLTRSQTTRLCEVLPNFSETGFEVLKVKWNRLRQHVPHDIYNGVIFEWVEDRLLAEPFTEDEGLFYLKLSNAIGSPEFLHRLVCLALDKEGTVPSFGLGFLLSTFRGKLKPFELLDTLLGSVLPRVGSDDEEEVKDLYQDWLHWKMQHVNCFTDPDEPINIPNPVKALPATPVNQKDARNLKRKVLCSEFVLDMNVELSSKRPRVSAPPKSRSGRLLQWFNPTTFRFKPDSILHDKENENQENTNVTFAGCHRSGRTSYSRNYVLLVWFHVWSQHFACLCYSFKELVRRVLQFQSYTYVFIIYNY